MKWNLYTIVALVMGVLIRPNNKAHFRCFSIGVEALDLPVVVKAGHFYVQSRLHNYVHTVIGTCLTFNILCLS